MFFLLFFAIVSRMETYFMNNRDLAAELLRIASSLKYAGPRDEDGAGPDKPYDFEKLVPRYSKMNLRHSKFDEDYLNEDFQEERQGQWEWTGESVTGHSWWISVMTFIDRFDELHFEVEAKLFKDGELVNSYGPDSSSYDTTVSRKIKELLDKVEALPRRGFHIHEHGSYCLHGIGEIASFGMHPESRFHRGRYDFVLIDGPNWKYRDRTVDLVRVEYDDIEGNVTPDSQLGNDERAAIKHFGLKPARFSS